MRYLAFFFLAPCLPGQQWESLLLPSADGHWERRKVSFAGRDWQLDDFSYAGYQLGAAPLASVPCRVAALDGEGDITGALEAAIDAIGRAGGGVIRIPAGNFIVSRTVTITRDNIAIEGAGSGRTTIRVPESYRSRDEFNEGVFTFGKAQGGWNQGWVHQGRLVSRVAARVARGSFHADAEDASSIRPGDWVVLQQYFWKDFVDRHSSDPNRWVSDGSNRTFSFTYLRRVLARSANRVFFDAPIPWDLDPANNPVWLRLTDNRMVENVGIRGLSIEFAANRNSSAGRPLGTAVYFEGVRNGWAADVKARNIGRFGFHTTHSARITFLDSEVRGVQDYGGDGYGYGFHIHSSQNILMKRCQVDDARRPFTSQRALTSTLVYSECSSSNATQGDDTHHSMIHWVLWDRHRQRDGVNLTAYNRGNFSTGAYETLGSGAVWNFDGDGIRGRVSTGGQIHLKPSPDGQAILVGGTGAHAVFDSSNGNPFRAGERMQSRAGLQTGGGAGAAKNVLYEGLGQPGLEPPSLFDALLAGRTGSAAIPVLDECRPAPESEIAPGGVVNAASSQGGFPLAPGSLAAIYGKNLSGLVRVGSRAAPILYSSAEQVNIQVPWETEPGAPGIAVGAATATIPVARAAPAIFLHSDGTAVAQHPDGAAITAEKPARPSQAIVVYLTGAGAVDGPITTGRPAPSDRLFRATLPASATVGGLAAEVLFLGLTPGFTGLYQANLIVPASLAPGNHPVQIVVDGVLSNAPAVLIGPS